MARHCRTCIRFLSTIQIGITAIGILNGIIGEAVFADPFGKWLIGLGLDPDTSRYVATALVVVVITYVTIVVGELVPKRLGQLNPEVVARGVARPMQWLAAASRPFVRLLTWSTDSLLKLFPKPSPTGAMVTEEEIHAMLEEGSEAGVIERVEHAMVRNVFRLDDRQIASLMVPRGEIVFLDLDRPLVDLADTDAAPAGAQRAGGRNEARLAPRWDRCPRPVLAPDGDVIGDLPGQRGERRPGRAADDE